MITWLCNPHIFVSPSKLVIKHPQNPNIFLHKCNQIKNIKCNTTLTKCAISGHNKFPGIELETSNKTLKTNELYKSVGLERELMPKHIAIALDGNRRWLKKRGRELDYVPFFDATMEFAKLCLKWDVPLGSGFMWGLSNFSKRGDKANDLFLGQFQDFLEDNLDYFIRNGIKIMAMGETTLLSKSIQDTIKKVEESTKNNSKLLFSLPICYTGQRDIRNATIKLCEKVKQGVLEPSDITEDMIQNELSIPSSPVPDLFIRTGGELRIGALLGWQIAHIELYFTDLMAPDFSEDVFLDALRSFQQRNRKFGK